MNSTTSDSFTINLTSSAPSATQLVRFNTGIANNNLIEIGIAIDDDYIIDTNNPNISFRVDNGASFPEVWFLDTPPSGGISEGSVASFQIFSTVTQRTAPLPIYLSVSEGETNFLANIVTPPAIIPINLNFVYYNVPTLSDGVDGNTDGTITVKIIPGPNYKLGATETSEIVTVIDDGSDQQEYLTVSVIAPRSTIAGEPFDVTLRARPILGSGQSINVTYRITESGNFTQYLNHTPMPVYDNRCQ